jgi:hypothetical protein
VGRAWSMLNRRGLANPRPLKSVTLQVSRTRGVGTHGESSLSGLVTTASIPVRYSHWAMTAFEVPEMGSREVKTFEKVGNALKNTESRIEIHT